MKRHMSSGRKWDRRKALPRSQGRVALLPASELAKMPAWAQRAKALRGGELVVIPTNNPRLENLVQRIKVTMSRHGRPVIVTKVH